MGKSRASTEGDSEGKVISALRASGSDSASVDDLVGSSQLDSREEAQTVLRKLVNQGKVSQTPDWEYKLATRLR